jgi:hypothetical protein
VKRSQEDCFWQVCPKAASFEKEVNFACSFMMLLHLGKVHMDVTVLCEKKAPPCHAVRLVMLSEAKDVIV